MLRVGQSCLLLQAFWAGSASFNTRHTLASGTYNSIALLTAKRMEEVDQTYSERFALTRRAWNNTPMSPVVLFLSHVRCADRCCLPNACSQVPRYFVPLRQYALGRSVEVKRHNLDREAFGQPSSLNRNQPRGACLRFVAVRVTMHDRRRSIKRA